MKKPLVSVVLPVHNGQKYLHAAIGSVLAQTFKNFELIVINDGSTDSTAEIIKSFDDPRIVYICNEQNLGLIASLNLGIARAKGELIARMDSDDVAISSRLEIQVEYLDQFSDCDVVGSAVVLINEFNVKSQIYHFPKTDALIKWALSFYCPLAHPTVMMRSSIFLDGAKYSHNREHAEDYDLWIRLSESHKFGNISDPLLLLRKHSDSLTQQKIALHISMVEEISRNNFINNYGFNLPKDVISCLVSSGKRCSNFSEQAIQYLNLYKNKFIEINNNLSVSDLKHIARDIELRIFLMRTRRALEMNKYLVFSFYLLRHPFISVSFFSRFLKMKIGYGAVGLG